jgi:hypothetical protein
MRKKYKVLIGVLIVVSLVILLVIFKANPFSVLGNECTASNSASVCQSGKHCAYGACLTNSEECALDNKLYVTRMCDFAPGASCSPGCIEKTCNSDNDCISTTDGVSKCNTNTHTCYIPCSHGENVPYCGTLEKFRYFKCNNGVVSSVACPSSPIQFTCVNGACITPIVECTPKTCSQLGKNCGDWQDGCGGGNYVNCGTCSSGQCVQGKCTQNTPKTCSQLDRQCGTWGDGAGGMLNCGSCTSPLVCNAYGKCATECNPLGCSQLGKQCGVYDSCGARVNCGSCSATDDCVDGQCVFNEENLETCKSCEEFAISTLTLGLWKDKMCNAKGWTLSFKPLPQTGTTCWLDFIKLLAIPLVLVFSLLFGSDFLMRFGALRNNKWAKWLVNLLVAGILAYVVYISFWIGVILFVVYLIIRTFFGGVIKKLI